MGACTRTRGQRELGRVQSSFIGACRALSIVFRRKDTRCMDLWLFKGEESGLYLVGS